MPLRTARRWLFICQVDCEFQGRFVLVEDVWSSLSENMRLHPIVVGALHPKVRFLLNGAMSSPSAVTVPHKPNGLAVLYVHRLLSSIHGSVRTQFCVRRQWLSSATLFNAQEVS